MRKQLEFLSWSSAIRWSSTALFSSVFLRFIRSLKTQASTTTGFRSLPAMALALLIKSADVFIEGAKGLAYRAGLPEVVIGLTIVSIGTSLPEILVTSTAAADIPTNPEIGDLAIGGIYGSILVQITLILGVVVAFRGVKVRPSWLKRDGFIMFASIALVTLFLFTGEGLSRIEGALLMSLYIAYIYWLLSHRDEILEEELSGGNRLSARLLARQHPMRSWSRPVSCWRCSLLIIS